MSEQDDDIFLARVGANVRRERTRQKLSQADLAKRCGVNRQIIGRLELGQQNCSLDTLRWIAIGLDASITTFFDGVDLDLLKASTSARSWYL